MPTPVSALLHAATLVTAGIYLLIRISPILEFSGSVLLIITLIGSSTAFFAATCGLLQNDLKRIIAFSTISQLGYILLLILLFFLIYNILYLEDIHTSIFSKIIQNSIIPQLATPCSYIFSSYEEKDGKVKGRALRTWGRGLIFNIKLIEHKPTYFSPFGFRNYKTGNAGYKNQSENAPHKINLKLAQSSLDEDQR